MSKAEASRLIEQAWDAINALTAAYKENRLPTDLYSDDDVEQAHTNVWGSLAPLIYAEVADIEDCLFNDVVERLGVMLNIPDPDAEV